MAAELDQTAYNIRAPGGTRKIAYLSGTPSSLIENYRLIIASLHGRIAWVQQGHRHQKLDHLLEVGRKLSDPSFVVFLTLFTDVMGGIVRPFAKMVQASCEPVVFFAAQRQLLTDILHAMMALRRCRILFRVLCLCRQHAPIEDLRNLAEAFSYGSFIAKVLAHAMAAYSRHSLSASACVAYASLESRLLRDVGDVFGCQNVGRGGERPSAGSPHFCYVVARRSGLLRRGR